MRNYRRPYKAKKKKSILKNRIFWLSILVLTVFSGVFYLILFHSFFQIKTVEISGNKKVSTENLENLLNEEINRKILSFPSRSIFLADFGKINREVLKNFHVNQVSLKRKFPSTLFLQIKEREAAAVFTQSDKSFVIDKEGFIFDFFDSGEEEQTFIKFKKIGEVEMDLRDKVIDEDQLSKILEAESKLKNLLNVLAEDIIIISEVRFDVKTSEGFKIYFNFQEDLDWQIAKLKAALEEEFPPGERGNLEYIDIRFGDFAVPVSINR